MYPENTGAKSAENTKPKSETSENQSPKLSPPNFRSVTILTDGDKVSIEKLEVSRLELCEICRRLIKWAGGE
jgi:hypothetical protein